MKIIAIILFTIAAIALFIIISSTLNIIRWRNVKEMHHGSQISLIISFLVLLGSLTGGVWSINYTPSVTATAAPAIQKKKPALPGAAKASTSSNKPNTEKPKGTMISTFSNAKQYSYQELIASDNLVSKAFDLNQAQVVQVGENKGHSFVLAFDTSAPKDFYIIIFNGLKTIQVGNKISVTGTLGKRTPFQTANNQNKIAPTIYAVQSSISGQ